MQEIVVYYNGSCPVCRREIAHYRRLAEASRAPIVWHDVARDAAPLQRLGLGAEDLRRRLHVLGADGRLRVGVPAFAAIWQRLPRYHWLARLADTPPFGRLLGLLYEPLARRLYRRDRARRGLAAAG